MQSWRERGWAFTNINGNVHIMLDYTYIEVNSIKLFRNEHFQHNLYNEDIQTAKVMGVVIPQNKLSLI